ncbi:MAG: hypothetical protein RSA51_06375 [Niameybacter sp.]
MSLKEELQRLNINDRHGDLMHLSLMELIKRARIKTQSNAKVILVDHLTKFLMDPMNIEGIWKGLSPFEKICMKDCLINGTYLFAESIKGLAKVHNIDKRQVINFGWSSESEIAAYLPENSKMGLFFVNGQVPEEVLKVLLPKVGTITFDLTKSQVTEEDLKETYVFEQEGDLREDLITFVKCAVGNKVKVTASSGYPTKGSMKSINERLANKEYETEYISWDTLRKCQDMYRLRGLYDILIDAKVLEVNGTSLILGSEGKKFLALPFTEQVKMLFTSYKESKMIDEIQNIKGEKLLARVGIGLSAARETLLRLLGRLDSNEWISMEVFSEQLFKCARCFLYNFTHGANYAFSRYGYAGLGGGDWERVERAYLDVVLLDYLVPLGIVDVAVEDVEVQNEMTGNYTDRLEVTYFKITKLGAYILGSAKVYEDPTMKDKVDNDLWIDEWQQVVVGESKKEHQHHIFFEAFCEKGEGERHVAYPLNFSAILKAFHEEISLDQIWTYLEKNVTKPLPTHLKGVFDKWSEDQKKVRIRVVTILECEDPAILEELKDTTGVKKHTKQVLQEVLELYPGTGDKVKKEVEKQYYFCNNEIGRGGL